MNHWHVRNAIKDKTTLAGGDHIVIIGPYGNIWHDGTFPTAEAAEEYLRKFWKGTRGFDPTEWRLACATVAIEAFEPTFRLPSDSDGTATAALNEDLAVPQDCQARAESIAQMPPQQSEPREQEG